MRTPQSIKKAIEEVIASHFHTTKVLVKHESKYTRIYLDSIHASDFIGLNNLADVLNTLNKDRDVFVMVDSKTVETYDKDIRKMMNYSGNYVRSITSIFFHWGKKV